MQVISQNTPSNKRSNIHQLSNNVLPTTQIVSLASSRKNSMEFNSAIHINLQTQQSVSTPLKQPAFAGISQVGTPTQRPRDLTPQQTGMQFQSSQLLTEKRRGISIRAPKHDLQNIQNKENIQFVPVSSDIKKQKPQFAMLQRPEQLQESAMKISQRSMQHSHSHSNILSAQNLNTFGSTQVEQQKQIPQKSRNSSVSMHSLPNKQPIIQGLQLRQDNNGQKVTPRQVMQASSEQVTPRVTNSVQAKNVLDEKISQLLQENEKLNKLVVQKSETEVNYTKQIQLLQEQLEGAQNKIKEFLNRKLNTEQTTENDQKDLEEVEKRIDSLEKTISSQEEEIQSWKTKFEDRLKKSLEYEKEVNKQTEISNKYKQSLDEIDNKIQEVIQENQRMNILLEEKEQQILKLMDNTDQLLTKNQELKDKSQSNIEKDEKNEEQQDTIGVYKLECQGLKEALQEKNHQLMSLQADLDSYKVQLWELNQNGSSPDQQVQIKDLENKLELSQTMIKNRNQEQEEKIEKKLEEVIKENENMVLLLQQCEENLVNMKEENELLKEQVSVLDEQKKTSIKIIKEGLLKQIQDIDKL